MKTQNLPKFALIEGLEPRLLMSGESVSYQLAVTDMSGNPIDSIEAGRDFELRAYVQDQRGTPQGVFAGYIDVTFDQLLAHSTGDFSYGGGFPNGQSGDVSVSGLLDEAGAFAGVTPTGNGLKLLFIATMTADTAGTLVFASNAADDPGHDTLVYGSDSPLSAGQILYGQASIEVTAADLTAPTAQIADPVDGGSIVGSDINGRGYIDVTFADTGGSGLDIATITDAQAEFTLAGGAAAGVTVDGAATHVSGNTYRYSFTGSFATGPVTVNFTDGAWADNSGNANAADSQDFSVVAGQPEISISGKNNEIVDGDTTPSVADDTDFGGVDVNDTVTHTFTIANSGNGPLTLTGNPLVEITGSTDFTVSVLPASDVNAAGSTTFQIEFTPSGLGNRTATITVLSDDASEGSYEFSVQGFGGRMVSFGGKTKGQFIDSNGDTVVLALSGVGSGQAWFSVADPSAHANADSIVLSGTDIKSAMTVTAKGGDSRTTVGGITVQGPLKSITGKGLNVDGDILVDGTLGNLTVGDITGDHQIGTLLNAAAATDSKAKLTLQAGVVHDMTLNTHGQPINSVTVVEWKDTDGTSDSIISSWVGTIKTTGRKATTAAPASALPGDFDVILDLDSARDHVSALSAKLTLGSASISGSLTPDQWEIAGDAGAITAGDVGAGKITAGSIKSIKTTGRKVAGVSGVTGGDFAADLDLTGSSAQAALGSTTIAGDLLACDWNITGSLTGLKVGGQSQAILKITGSLGSASVSGTLTPDQWEIAGDAGAITAGDVGAGKITAGSIKSIKTTGRKVAGVSGVTGGDFAADLELTGTLVKATLGSTTIAGDLLACDWNITGSLAALKITGRAQATVKTTGSMGALSFGAISGADFFAGVDTTAAGDPAVTRHADDLADLDMACTIKSITIMGIKGAAATTAFFEDSNFSAGSIGTVSLINAAYDAGLAGPNASDKFGFWAKTIKSVTHKNLLDKADCWAWPKSPSTAAQVDLTIEQLV